MAKRTLTAMENDHFFKLAHLYMPMDDQFLVGKNPAKGEKKRRFTDDQIRSLESMFQSHQAKLEPKEKVELARELGLQPRQVSIWFQNKQARWKSKQLEKEYVALRLKYDELLTHVEALKEENQALVMQSQNLTELVNQKNEHQKLYCKDGSSTASSCHTEENQNVCTSNDEKRMLSGMGENGESEMAWMAAVDHVDQLHWSSPPYQFCAPSSEPWDLLPLIDWNAPA